MDENTPDWLDQTFVETVLQGGKDKEPNVTVVNYTVKYALTPGENFASYVFRVLVHYKLGESNEEQKRSIVVKQPVKVGLLYEIASNTQFYDKEAIFYGELLQKMSEKSKYQFAPKSFYSPILQVIVLEDLKPDYVVIDKNKQLDLSHSKLVFKTLAKYHASTVAVYHEKPELIKSVSGECEFTSGGPIQKWVEFGTKFIGDFLNEVEGCKEYADFILSKVDGIWESAVECLKARPGRFNVLVHGDIWTTNLMFKYNEANELVDLKLIDFQLARYTTPVMDLLYYLYTSANDDIRDHNQLELFDIYVTALNKSLEQVGCKERMTIEELKEHIKHAVPWFLAGFVYGIVPILVHGSEDGLDLEGITGKDISAGKCNAIFAKMYSCKQMKATIPKYMRQYFSMLKSL